MQKDSILLQTTIQTIDSFSLDAERDSQYHMNPQSTLLEEQF